MQRRQSSYRHRDRSRRLPAGRKLLHLRRQERPTLQVSLAARVSSSARVRPRGTNDDRQHHPPLPRTQQPSGAHRLRRRMDAALQAHGLRQPSLCVALRSFAPKWSRCPRRHAQPFSGWSGAFGSVSPMQQPLVDAKRRRRSRRGADDGRRSARVTGLAVPQRRCRRKMLSSCEPARTNVLTWPSRELTQLRRHEDVLADAVHLRRLQLQRFRHLLHAQLARP